MEIINRRVERTEPCLMPFWRQKVGDFFAPMAIWVVELE